MHAHCAHTKKLFAEQPAVSEYSAKNKNNVTNEMYAECSEESAPHLIRLDLWLTSCFLFSLSMSQ